MTNREALQSEIAIRLSNAILDRQLTKQGLVPEGESSASDPVNQRAIDLALAGLIRYLCLSPESVRELDFQLTQRAVDDLLRIRAGILAKYDKPDEMSDAATITDLSDTW